MTDILLRLDRLRRPRLLIRAARLGADDYRRDLHLPRLLGRGALPRSLAALQQLMEIEAAQDEARRQDAAGYSIMLHVETMIAMIGEARILRATLPGLLRPPPPGMAALPEAPPVPADPS